MAGLGIVEIGPACDELGLDCPIIKVTSEKPVAACMAAQYAGWQIVVGKYFAMGSGPMRAAAAKEELFQHIGYVEKSDVAVGILETAKLPSMEVCQYIARECHVRPERLTLLAARTASAAGTLQIVARSVETALHKLHELGFDLSRVVSGFGSAPLPPVAANDLLGIGLTNDAILYGGDVTLRVRGDDESLRQIGPLVPSSASPDHGVPFLQIFERYERDFYRIDRRLFSPAVITLANVDSGQTFRFGRLEPEILRRSFGTA
jgi:methenyltetrahydromethanopterin cyclohydrolase